MIRFVTRGRARSTCARRPGSSASGTSDRDIGQAAVQGAQRLQLLRTRLQAGRAGRATSGCSRRSSRSRRSRASSRWPTRCGTWSTACYGPYAGGQADARLRDASWRWSPTPDALLDHLNTLLFCGRHVATNCAASSSDALDRDVEEGRAAARAGRPCCLLVAVARVRDPEVAAEPDHAAPRTLRHDADVLPAGACSTIGYGALISTIGDLYTDQRAGAGRATTARWSACSSTAATTPTT